MSPEVERTLTTWRTRWMLMSPEVEVALSEPPSRS
jgi:hypothetical protein